MHQLIISCGGLEVLGSMLSSESEKCGELAAEALSNLLEAQGITRRVFATPANVKLQTDLLASASASIQRRLARATAFLALDDQLVPPWQPEDSHQFVIILI